MDTLNPIIYASGVFAEALILHDEISTADQFVRLYDATWSDYQRTLELRAERSVPRLTYSEGVLELMSPSKSHETLKSMIGRLIEVWCLANDIEFNAYGSWTLEKKELEKGVEPDECYVFGEEIDSTRPDLAIEVIWTSGGLDKRAIYRSIGVPELWVWRKGKIHVYVLRADGYVEVDHSEALPNIDLTELTGLLDLPTASKAIKAYASAIAARRAK